MSNQTDVIPLINTAFVALGTSLVSRDALKGLLFWRWPLSAASADSTSISPGQPAFKCALCSSWMADVFDLVPLLEVKITRSGGLSMVRLQCDRRSGPPIAAQSGRHAAELWW